MDPHMFDGIFNLIALLIAIIFCLVTYMIFGWNLNVWSPLAALATGFFIGRWSVTQ